MADLKADNSDPCVDQKFESLQERNARVEADKAWETSKSRRAFIMIVTYIVAGLYMKSIGTQSPWLGAFVPTMGYFLSTLSLPFIQSAWMTHVYKKQESETV